MAKTSSLKISGRYELLLTEFFSGFAYYGFRSVFLIYLIQTLGISHNEGIEIFYAFISLHFVTQVFCGWISDQYTGNQKGIWLGGTLIFLGSINTLLPLTTTQFLGFALFVIGTSLIRVNIIALLGKLHSGNDDNRDYSFTLWKVFGNLSLFAGAVLLASLYEVATWKNSAFLMCGISALIAVMICYFNREKFGYHGLKPSISSELQGTVSNSTLYLFYGVVLILVSFVTAFLLWKNEWLGMLIPIFAAISIVITLHISLVKKVFSSMIFMMVLFIFYLLYLTIFHHASALWLLFINGNLDRSLQTVFGFSLVPDVYHEVPMIFVKSLNAVFVVLIGPILAYVWYKLGRLGKNPGPMAKFALGFCFSALSFSILSLSRNYSYGEGIVPVWWFFLAHFFYAVGEMMILPIAFSRLTQLAPRENITLFVGMWLMAGAISIYLNKYFTRIFVQGTPKPSYDGICSLNSYCDAFGLLSWICFFLALTCFLFSFFEYRKLPSKK